VGEDGAWGHRVRRVLGVKQPVGPDAAELVDALFRVLLGREADDEARAFFIETVESGYSLLEVVDWVAHSEEAVRKLPKTTMLADLREYLWARPQPARTAFFLHVMKTGGTALREALLRVTADRYVLTDILLDELVCLPDYVLARASLVAGHLPFEAVNLLPGDPLVFTIVRDPVERTVSHYWHLRGAPWVATECPDFSLEEFVESPRWATLASNYQARYLTHEIGIAGAWVEWSPVERFAEQLPHLGEGSAHKLQTLFDSVPLALEGDRLEKAALARLDEIELVGISERLDPLFREIAAFFGENDPAPVDRTNVGVDRPAVADVPPSLVQRIREVNHADLALYDRACERVAAGSMAAKNPSTA